MAEQLAVARLQALLPPVQTLAHEAGRCILSYYRKDPTIQEKPNRTPVTAADYAAHDVLAQGLKQLTPDWPVLSEEDRAPPYAERRRWPCYWLVDPLDGTREFIHGNDEFCVSIALVEQHTAVLGLIHIPVTGIDYGACRDTPAWRQTPADTAALPIQTCRPARTPPRIAVSRWRRGPYLTRALERMGAYTLRETGGAIKTCLVAEGSADLYPCLGPTSEWDTAAAQCILEQAGGGLTNLGRQALRYNTKDTLLNPPFLAYGDAAGDWHRYFE